MPSLIFSPFLPSSVGVCSVCSVALVERSSCLCGHLSASACVPSCAWRAELCAWCWLRVRRSALGACPCQCSPSGVCRQHAPRRPPWRLTVLLCRCVSCAGLGPCESMLWCTDRLPRRLFPNSRLPISSCTLELAWFCTLDSVWIARLVRASGRLSRLPGCVTPSLA